MRRWVIISAALAFALCAANALANVPPTMDDQYVNTVENRAVTFELRAEDADIDPLNPAAHPLVFTILGGPDHGVLVGNLLDVYYRAPHEAVIKVTYIPARGFAGKDFVTLSVRDPFDKNSSGIVTIQIDVEAARRQGILSGTFETAATLDVQTGEFTVFRTKLKEVYRIAQLTLKGVAELKSETLGTTKRTVFDSLQLEGRVSFSNFSLTSTLDFEPGAALPEDMFESWRTTTRYTIAGLSLTHTSYFPNEFADACQTLVARAEIGSYTVSSSLRLEVIEGCEFGFSENRITVAWEFCNVPIRSELLITCAGFQEISFGARGIPVPAIAWFPRDIGLNLEVTFTPEEKSLSAAFEWRPNWINCIRVCAGLTKVDAGVPQLAGDTRVTGIAIYGLIVECPLPGDIYFRSATSLDEGKNMLMTGQTDYFEAIRIGGPLNSCCGIPGTWSVAIFFRASSTTLFDWGMTRAQADVGITDSFSASFELTSRSGELGDSTCELRFGCTVRW